MNVCRAALNAERGRALMIQLEASFVVSRAEFWKNCGIENWSEQVSWADAGRQRRGSARVGPGRIPTPRVGSLAQLNTTGLRARVGRAAKLR